MPIGFAEGKRKKMMTREEYNNWRDMIYMLAEIADESAAKAKAHPLSWKRRKEARENAEIFEDKYLEWRRFNKAIGY